MQNYGKIFENYDVDLNVDPAYSRIDQIYVLRKCKRKEAWADIDPVVVIKDPEHEAAVLLRLQL